MWKKNGMDTEEILRNVSPTERKRIAPEYLEEERAEKSEEDHAYELQGQENPDTLADAEYYSEDIGAGSDY